MIYKNLFGIFVYTVSLNLGFFSFGLQADNPILLCYCDNLKTRASDSYKSSISYSEIEGICKSTCGTSKVTSCQVQIGNNTAVDCKQYITG